MVALKLAQVAFLLDKLNMVVLAVKSALVCNVVGWTNGASSVAAFETALMVRRSIHRDLSIFFVARKHIVLTFNHSTELFLLWYGSRN